MLRNQTNKEHFYRTAYNLDGIQKEKWHDKIAILGLRKTPSKSFNLILYQSCLLHN